MDTQEVNFQQEILNCESEEQKLAYSNTEKSCRDFDEKPIRDAYFDSHSSIHEKINIKLDQVEPQSTFESISYTYGLDLGKQFVKPEFVLPEELGIKVEDQEEDRSNTERFQNEVNFSVNTYVKSETTKSESEADEPVKQLQNSNIHEDTIKEESFVKTDFLIHEEVNIKSEDEGNDQTNTQSAMGQIKKRHHPSNRTSTLHKISTNNRRFYLTEPPVFKCLNCTYQTHRKRNIANHVFKHMDKTLKCLHCSYETNNKGSLKKHELVHVPKEQVMLHQCPECSYASIWKDSITQHIMSKHKKPDDVIWHKCTLCLYKSYWKSSLMKHIKHMHRPKDIQLIHCPKEGCLFKTSEETYLENHIRRIHECNRFFECSKCSFQTKYARSFKAHELRHEDQSKWFSCNLCPFKAITANNLKQHMVVHKSGSEIRWFRCSECPFKTKHGNSLNQHKINHSLNPERILKCSECSYKTVYAPNLRTHRLVHKKPEDINEWFYCYLCTLKTPRKNSLARHIRTMHRDTNGRISDRANTK